MSENNKLGFGGILISLWAIFVLALLFTQHGLFALLLVGAGIILGVISTFFSSK